MSARTAQRSRKNERLAAAAPLFAALGDETRLDLLSRLCMDGPMSITRLTAGVRITRQAVTKHLHVLAEAGLAHGTRVGRDQVWKVEPRRLDDARRWLDHIESQWDEALGRLKASLERPGTQRSHRDHTSRGSAP
jgi:DNA-binding transcriptional ArsR family regulator